MSATVVGFISEKGGVGKTTACYHIAIGLSRMWRKRVLVIDTDYQRGGMTVRLVPSLLEHFKQGTVPGNTLYHVFRSLYGGFEEIPHPNVLHTRWEIDLIPSDPRLAEVTADKLPGSNNIRENNLKLFKHLSAIDTAIGHLKESYDYILVDTHPEISDLLRAVIFACNYCVSPVKLDEQSTVGVPSAIEAIRAVNDDVAALAAAVGIVTYHPTEYQGAIGMMAREYGGGLKYTELTQYNRLKKVGGVFTTYTTEGDGLREAAAHRVPVYDIASANAQKQAEQFINITREFVGRCP